MNIAYNLDQVNLQNVFFLESKKNIIMEGKFTKIVYSDELISTSGISVIVPLHSDRTLNKNQLKFQTNDASNVYITSRLIEIEQRIIEYYKNLTHSNKTPVLILRDHIKNGCLKIYRGNHVETKTPGVYIVKISGIWEDQYRIGLTYKFLETLPII
jgi:hypothetical protein